MQETFLKTDRATTVPNEYHPLPSFFSSLLLLLPGSSHSLASCLQQSQAKADKPVSSAVSLKALASLTPPGLPTTTQLMLPEPCARPGGPVAVQDTGVTGEPGAASHQPLWRCCWAGAPALQTERRPDQLSASLASGQVHLFPFPSLTFL